MYQLYSGTSVLVSTNLMLTAFYQVRHRVVLMLALIMMLVVGIALPTAKVQAESINTLGDAINQAGSQRMLTQRMLKNYALIGQSIRGRSAQQQLDESIALFDQQLVNLKRYSNDLETLELLANVTEQWAIVKKEFQQTPQKNKVLSLRNKNDALLAAANQVVLSLEHQSQTRTGQLVNVAGRQRMLSQRMAASYALMAWGFEAEIKPIYEQAYQEFDSALDYLSSNPTNSSAISSSLADVRQQFKRFTMTSQAADKHVYVPGLIDRSAEKVLKRMNEVTALYAGAFQ
ncbi:type IV pili methyl-accepting chemotaxis transducer N-terminal domain-containing protein [Neptunomonas phycophila]|uniref:type IV pili methyl-accepting chemotaxis transducer N-terminal domain-containing protein n=1 Tax=Neptunomonas phycophila TaxID=1572645 RepID=UPI0015BE258F|nr:type IV pili methyl-accepting chemotaxis transducer N-terminal domain-containing protein [Neptunomonas phycophila]QLE99157.1 hypothetical protein FLM49_16845 [Neptunomonas phycophila]